MDASEFFRTEWRSMAARISGSLGRRGVAPSDREDVLQETALRLYRSWDQVDPDRPVEPYARVIAYNVWRDSLRRSPREEPVEVVPEVVGKSDLVEQTCVVRDELSHVRRAMARMRPEQRNVLRVVAAEELGAAKAEPAVSDALRMARMRARRQLRAALQVASSVAAVLAALRRIRPRALPVGTASVVLVAGMLLLFTAPQQQEAAATPLGPTDSGVVAATVADDVLSAHRSASTHGASRVAAPAAPRPAVAGVPAPRPPVRIQAGPAEVGLAVNADVLGYGVEVGETGHQVPACVNGVGGGLDGLADELRCAK